MKKGTKMTIESRNLMSLKKIGYIPWNKGKKTGQKPTSPFRKGQTPWNKGIPLSEETKRKLSQSKIGRYEGNNHPLWNGGKIAYQKRIAKERDKYTCQRCGYFNEEFKSSAVDVDHILPKRDYPELKEDINNLITLCPNCHRIKTLKSKDYKSKGRMI